LPGWKSPTAGKSRFEDLPENARKYLARIEELCATPIAMISTGRERTATILNRGSKATTVLDQWLPRR
jgi:adenylosuccinate synthase